MAIDESFKKPGAVPFKWEIEPGVPRPHSSLKPSPKLTPPPVSAAGKYCYPPPMEVGFLSSTTNTRSTARSRSVSSRLRSERLRFERPNSVDVISGSTGCFPPLLKKKEDKKKKRNAKTEALSADSEVDDYVCDLETLARRSISTRRMVSPFRDSVYSSSSSSSSLYGSPSSFSSVRSSPRAAGDAEWAAFGLF